ncbi:hypothetical protein KUTeg_000084 [Tegillarca granosa]|uniref:F5/8 type C domain-containing protein n=1 Tax=Tegillarca granosa TaxID=220873 RepID=A0ABQ9G0Y0_TEGGR|nr:hypothetical protein KUTeg_000084 [Tegillarca granosa]
MFSPENLALGKRANQGRTHWYHKATKAVYGNVSQKGKYCAHTAIFPKQDVAWWQVDLGKMSEIKYIKIYYRDENTIRRFNGFRLYIGTSENWFDEDQCYRDTEDGYPPSVVTVNCTGLAQYITIVNSAYDEKDKQYGPILELFEVQVFGKSTEDLKYGVLRPISAFFIDTESV